MSESKDFLMKKIADLEAQLMEKTSELSIFRNEFNKTNSKLKQLVSIMKSELDSLHSLQKKIIPTTFPTIPGFEFSSKFNSGVKNGGDYFDIISHRDKSKFGILVASCSSYIVSALLMATVLRNIHSIEANQDADPTYVMTQIIGAMQDGLEKDQNLDLFYGVFDRKKFELNYILIGDILALHQEGDRNNLSLIRSQNSALFRTSHLDLDVKNVKLNPNDRLIFLTKGGYLAEGRDGHVFGKEKVMQSVLDAPKKGAHELRNYISYHLMKFNLNDKPQRDTTIVVAEVKDRVIKLA